MMGRPRPAAAPAPPVGKPTRCEACHRTGTTLVSRVLDDGSVAQVCADPVDCHRHWPADDKPGWSR
jgi:hypothetical protein